MNVPLGTRYVAVAFHTNLHFSQIAYSSAIDKVFFDDDDDDDGATFTVHVHMYVCMYVRLQCVLSESENAIHDLGISHSVFVLLC